MPVDIIAVRKALRDKLDGALSADYPSGIRVELDLVEVGAAPGPEVGIYFASQRRDRVRIGGPNPYDSAWALQLLCSVVHLGGVRKAVEEMILLEKRVAAAIQADDTLGMGVGADLAASVGDTEYESGRGEAGYFAAALLTVNLQTTS